MSTAGASAQERIATLVAALEAYDDPRLAPARELVQQVLELHGDGVGAMMRIIGAADANGVKLLEPLLADRRIVALLLLHGQHPHPLERRVRAAAVDSMRAELGTQSVRLEVVSVDPELARLKAAFSVSALALNVVALRQQIEAVVLSHAPEVVHVEIDGLPARGDIAVVPLSAVKRKSYADPQPASPG